MSGLDEILYGEGGKPDEDIPKEIIDILEEAKTAITAHLSKEIAKARLDELRILLAKFQQYHSTNNGFKHLDHEEAARDVLDRIASLENKEEEK